MTASSLARDCRTQVAAGLALVLLLGAQVEAGESSPTPPRRLMPRAPPMGIEPLPPMLGRQTVQGYCLRKSRPR